MDVLRWGRGSRCKLGWIAGISLLLATMSAFAQLPTGTVLGVVKDASGGVVPSAAITVKNTETGQTRMATTGDDGAYRMPALPVGHYTVKIEKAGFKTQTQGFTLEVTQELVVNSALEVGTSEQEVVVTGEAPLVNTTTSSLGGLVNEQQMSDLPLNGRNFVDLTLMQPGVTKSVLGPGAGTSGTYYSSNGATFRSNYITLDGASLVNQYGGSASEAGTTLGVDGIREYRVITNTPSAEYGMVMGSQMVIVSKGGSNRWSGDVFEYLRNSALDARNFFDYGYLKGGSRLPEFQRNNFGGAFGGPIKKDKTFIFAVYEGLRQNLGFTALDATFPANCFVLTSNPCATLSGGTVAPVIAPLLALYPSPNLPNNQFTFPATSKGSVDYGQMRMDQNFSAADTFFGRYTIDNSTLNNANSSAAPASSGIAFPGFRVAAGSRNQFLTVSENHIFSPMLLNTVRLSFSRTNFSVHNIMPSNLIGPQYSFVPGLPMGAINITSVSALGGTSSYGPPDIYHIQNIYTFSDDVYYTKGKHALKFGTLINRYNQGLRPAVFTVGQITFSDIAHFLQGVPLSYTSLAPGSILDRFYTYNTLGFYVQDDWRATSRLTLNLGLRYEFMTTVGELNDRQDAIRNIRTDTAPTHGPIMRNSSHKNISPRVGFAYDPTGKGKTSLRGGFGWYYDVGNIGALLEQEPVGTPPLGIKNSFTNSANNVLTLPMPYPAGSGSNGLDMIDYNFGQPQALEYNFTIERQMPGGVGLSVSYVGLRGLHINHIMEGNPIPATTITNGIETWQPFLCGGVASTLNTGGCGANPAYHRINPVWGSTIFLTTAGDSWYNALQVVANKRLSRGLELHAAYTFSKSLDTMQGQLYTNDCGGNFAGGSIVDSWDSQFPQYNKGESCFDAKHNLRLNVLYHFPNIKSDSFAAKFLKGWWVGNIVSVQSGYPFQPILAGNRSLSGNLTSSADRASLGTSTATLVKNFGTIANPQNHTYNFIPYDRATAITGDPQHWFNPLMFQLQPVGFLGSVPRSILREPGMGTWDFSVVKDTALPFLGEKGNVQFRAEFFNLLNRANFGPPNMVAFSGSASDIGPNSEAVAGATATNPLGTAGQITTTATTSRQIQLALKIIF